jgi:hypothetical protein
VWIDWVFETIENKNGLRLKEITHFSHLFTRSRQVVDENVCSESQDISKVGKAHHHAREIVQSV